MKWKREEAGLKREKEKVVKEERERGRKIRKQTEKHGWMDGWTYRYRYIYAA